MITLSGDNYASRGCASLLKAAKLNSLVTYSIDEYENTAINLAKNPKKLREIKEGLVDKSLFDLFDIKKFTLNLESGFQKIYDRYQNDLPPINIKF